MTRIKANTVVFSHIALASQLARENENLTLTPYHDTVDKLTCGYGRNLQDKGISIAEAELLLANDITEAHARLRSEFSFYRTLSTIRQAVFIDLYHNMGMNGLLTFKKLLRAAQFNDWDEASAQLQDSRYWTQTGIRAQRNYLMMRFDKLYSREEARSYFTNQRK